MPKQITFRAFFKRARPTTPLIAALVLVTGLTASAWAWLAPADKAEPRAPAARAETNGPAPSVNTAQVDSGAEGVEVELITLQPEGFEPSELTRPAGPFLLAFKNRSGQDDISLQVTVANGAREQTVRMPPGKHRSLNRLDLPPGQYVITEASHPEWVCRITLTQP